VFPELLVGSLLTLIFSSLKGLILFWGAMNFFDYFCQAQKVEEIWEVKN
jgi:hypothetical protein